MPSEIDKKPETEKYQGPGKLTSAVGGWVLWSVPGALVTMLASLPLANTIIQTIRNPDLIPESIWKVKGVKPALSGAIVGLGMAAYGAVSNWAKVGKEESQLNSIKSQRDQAVVRNEGLQTQVKGLNEEVEVYRKRFSDSIPSRASHGSHAHASEADKASAAAAALGV